MSKISRLAAGSVIAATAALGTGTVALADGYAPAKVTYQQPADWSGVYFGVGSGYQWSSIDVRGPAVVDDPALGISSNHDEWFVSAHAGVQHQWGVLVLGIEGGWMSTIRDREGNSEFCSGGPALTLPVTTVPGACTTRLNDIVTIGARAGWAAGHWMPYITGGYANAAFDFEDRTRAPAPPGTFGASVLQEQAHIRVGGWYIGTGFEWIISPGWTAGVEYRHYEFDGGSTTANSACNILNTVTPTPGCNFSGPFHPVENLRFGDNTADTLEMRVSWRWGREPTAAAPLK
jgi:high affinity Mn2+ porin